MTVVKSEFFSSVRSYYITACNCMVEKFGLHHPALLLSLFLTGISSLSRKLVFCVQSRLQILQKHLITTGQVSSVHQKISFPGTSEGRREQRDCYWCSTDSVEFFPILSVAWTHCGRGKGRQKVGPAGLSNIVDNCNLTDWQILCLDCLQFPTAMPVVNARKNKTDFRGSL